MSGRSWTSKEEKILLDHYEFNGITDVFNRLDRSKKAIYQHAAKMGLKRPENVGQFRKGICNSPESCFKKGNKPFNKGKKQTEWLSDEAIQKSKATRFKKGHTPGNHRPLGSERLGADGYVMIKVAEPNKWKLKHHVIYEKVTGKKIDKSEQVLTFKNLDRLDCRFENLELIDKKTAMERNTIQRFPKELKEVIHLLSKLNKEIDAKK